MILEIMETMETTYEHFICRYPPNRRSRRSVADLNSSTDAQTAAAAAAALASVGGAGKKLPTSAQLANLQAAWEVSSKPFPEMNFWRQIQIEFLLAGIEEGLQGRLA